MKKRARLSLNRETLRSLDESGTRRAAGGEFTFACSDNPCNTGLLDCDVDHNDTFGPECGGGGLTAGNCASGAHTVCCASFACSVTCSL